MNARAVVPDFELPATGNQRLRLSGFHARPLPRFHANDPVTSRDAFGAKRPLAAAP